GIGIVLDGDQNRIENTFVGLNADGSATLGNSADGVLIYGSNNVIGLPGFGTGNVISGNNGSGITVAGGRANVIQSNGIGTDQFTTADRGNAGPGIQITTSDTIVGGIG